MSLFAPSASAPIQSAPRFARWAKALAGLLRGAAAPEPPKKRVACGLWAFPVEVDPAGMGLWALGEPGADGACDPQRCFAIHAWIKPEQPNGAMARLKARLASPRPDPRASALSCALALARAQEQERGERLDHFICASAEGLGHCQTLGGLLLDAFLVLLAEKTLSGLAPAPFSIDSCAFSEPAPTEAALALARELSESSGSFTRPAWRGFQGAQPESLAFEADPALYLDHVESGLTSRYESRSNASSNIHESRYWLCRTLDHTPFFIQAERRSILEIYYGDSYWRNQDELWINGRLAFKVDSENGQFIPERAVEPWAFYHSDPALCPGAALLRSLLASADPKERAGAGYLPIKARGFAGDFSSLSALLSLPVAPADTRYPADSFDSLTRTPQSQALEEAFALSLSTRPNLSGAPCGKRARL